MARLVGQGASSRKYDLLTALGAAGLAGETTDRQTALRLMVLITARYDWRADRLSTGQREIAALWSVDERTVKRQMAKLREKGWLVLRRQGARGRVSEYSLGIAKLLEDTRAHWPAVGSDLVNRLSETSVPTGTLNVIPFPAPEGSTPWDRLLQALAADSPLLYTTWARQLQPMVLEAGEMRLLAPSRFHASYVETHLSLRLLSLSRLVSPEITSLRIEVAG
ncbi:hypothetical protein [Falsirhodobacter sp. alg1]|uniref:hypothetical protein n=1 Tax=Falsirhodobacter sp. alg1 TaxID=1472418 RepID=UPI00351C7242